MKISQLLSSRCNGNHLEENSRKKIKFPFSPLFEVSLILFLASHNIERGRRIEKSGSSCRFSQPHKGNMDLEHHPIISCRFSQPHKGTWTQNITQSFWSVPDSGFQYSSKLIPTETWRLLRERCDDQSRLQHN